MERKKGITATQERILRKIDEIFPFLFRKYYSITEFIEDQEDDKIINIIKKLEKKFKVKI